MHYKLTGDASKLNAVCGNRCPPQNPASTLSTSCCFVVRSPPRNQNNMALLLRLQQALLLRLQQTPLRLPLLMALPRKRPHQPQRLLLRLQQTPLRLPLLMALPRKRPRQPQRLGRRLIRRTHRLLRHAPPPG